MQTKQDRASAQKLLNTTQILITDVANLYQSAEYVSKLYTIEQIVQQLNYKYYLLLLSPFINHTYVT